MKYRLGYLLLFNLFLFFLLGSRADVKTHMDSMIEQTFALKPYIISPHEYAKSMNQKVIDKALDNLVNTTSLVHAEDKIKDTTLQMSASRLLQQLRESQVAFRTGTKDYSLWLLRSSLSNCLACHTQSPSGNTQFQSLSKSKKAVDNFQEAEFLYLARNYDAALKAYTQAIAEYPSQNNTWADVEQALYRKLYYYARIKRDLAGLQQSLTEDLKNKKFNLSLINLFKDYRNAAQMVQAPAYPEFSEKQGKDLRSFAENILQEEIQGKNPRESALRTLDNLRLSSVLYEYLNKYPHSELKPNILYWLSFCENHPRKFSFDFMSELYLKKCITEFPQNPVAAKCLKEYKDLVSVTYTGTSGASLPEGIQQELKSMESLLQNMKK